ncbi:unnamed protein product [Moneuplotes crassus]|uniref:Uncharacterized protein n=1 Tax=Euplotes crassus TaxID=5936 RepID=A0AAD1XMP5_EUPCR|nr:unnamed protein product [Moneuplotes crassus]
MNGQEMEFREDPNETQQQEQQPMEQERKYHNGGGGGGPSGFFAFGGSSKSSSTVCKPDPNNPGHQICKHITKTTKIDPTTGQRITTTDESEDTKPMRGFGGTFFGGGNSIPYENDNYDETPGIWGRVKGWLGSEENEPPAHEPSQPHHVATNNYSRNDFPINSPRDEFGIFNPFSMMREFERMISEDLGFEDGRGGYHGHHEHRDPFMGDPFMRSPFHHPHSNFEQRGPQSHFARDGFDDFFGFHAPTNSSQYTDQPRPSYSSSSQPPQAPQQEQSPPRSAASRANAKIYDV